MTGLLVLMIVLILLALAAKLSPSKSARRNLLTGFPFDPFDPRRLR